MLEAEESSLASAAKKKTPAKLAGAKARVPCLLSAYQKMKSCYLVDALYTLKTKHRRHWLFWRLHSAIEGCVSQVDVCMQNLPGNSASADTPVLSKALSLAHLSGTGAAPGDLAPAA